MRSPDPERGAVGGVEVLPFGLLVFVSLTLLIANLWAVVDAKIAVDAAAREAGRAFVEASDIDGARRAADRVGREVIEGAGRDPARVAIDDDDPEFRRCRIVEVRVSYRVPAVAVPFVGGFGNGVRVEGRYRERIDAFREGLSGGEACGPIP